MSKYINIFFETWMFFSPFIILFSITWYIFFAINNLKSQNYKTNKQEYNILQTFFSLEIFFFIKLCILNLILFSVFLTLDLGINFKYNFFCIEFTNFNLGIIFTFTIFTLLLFTILLNFSNQQVKTLTWDYLFVLLNIFLFFCLLFVTENVYTFFILIEINSLLIFLKLLHAKIFKKTHLENYNQILNFLNTLFFHYWISFFCTMLLLLLTVLLIYFYNSIEYIFILFLSNSLVDFIDYFLLYFFCFLLIISIILKLGISPMHLFKLEMYNSLNYIFLFFYLIYYFCGFFCVFFVTYLKFILPLCNTFIYFYLFLLIFAMAILIYFFFDYLTIKIFFSLSTVLNLISLSYITVLLFF